MVMQFKDMVAPKRVFKRGDNLEINPLLLQAFGITIEELVKIIKTSEEPEAMRDMFAFLSDYTTLSHPETRLFISGDKLDFMVADMRRRMPAVVEFYEYHAKTSGDIEEEERLLKFAKKAEQLSKPVGGTRLDKIDYIDAVIGFQHTSGLILPLAFGITDYGAEDYWPRKLLVFLRSHGMPGMVREGSAPDTGKPDIILLPLEQAWQMRAKHAYPGTMEPKRTGETMERLRNEMKRGGFEPIPATREELRSGILTEGKHRLIMAKELGITQVPIQIMEGKEDNMEYFIRENITPDIENVLRRLEIKGNTVKITEQLDRKLYERVNEVLERLGGKWNKSAKAHIFPSDPTERINTVLTAGKLEPKVKTGYFPTPSGLARRMVEMLDLKPGDKVLEPSAGQGGLLDQIPKGTQVIIGEILPENIQILKQKGYIVNFDNFLGVEIGGITKVIMNPPFENQQDIEHVTHALRILQPGGMLVSVMSPGIKFRDNKKTTEFIEMLDRDYYHEIIDLPEGSFKESGTGVGAVLLKVTKPMSTPSTVSGEFVADTTKVNPELAARSHMGTSMDPEKRAEQEIAGFGQYVQEVYDNLKKAARSEAQTAFLNTEIKRFQDSFAKKYNDLLARKGRTMSTFITGGSGFNVRRADKANDAEHAAYTDMVEFRDRAQAAILRELRKMSIEEQGGELEVLKKKLADAIKTQEFMKVANAVLRKKTSKEEKVKEIIAKTGVREGTVLALWVPDAFGAKEGFRQYELTNNNANIHRMQERVKELERKEATPSEDIPFEGGTISDNAEQDRVQINFDKKPEPAMIEKLKSEGWRWSPSNSAWQRKRTDMALRSARRIVGLPENWANPKFLEIKKDPTKEIYDKLRDKAGTEGVNKFEMSIARMIAISNNAPLRQQEVNRLQTLIASLPNLSLEELKALDKTVKRWGENLSELKAPLDYVYSELLKKAQAEEPKPFVSTAPDTLVSIVERSTPSPTQQTITALKPENVSPAIKPNDDIILEPYDPIEGWNRYIRTRVGNTEHFVANSIELKNILGGLGSIYYHDILYNKQNPITIKHTEYGYFKVLYFLENNYIDPKYIMKSESVAMLPEKQSPPQPLVSTAPDKLVSIVERSNITQPQTQAVIDLRWVYGTKDLKWYLVGHEDRDYAHGISQGRMKIIGQDAAKAEYLSSSFAAAPAVPEKMRTYVPPKYPPMLYPAPEVKKYTIPRHFKKGTIARNIITNEKFVLQTDVEALQQDKNAEIWKTNDMHGYLIYLEDQRPAPIPITKEPAKISSEDMQLLKSYEKITDYDINRRITLNQGKLKILAARKLPRIEKGQYGTMGSAYIEQERLGFSQEISRLYRIQELRELMAAQARPEIWELTQEEYWRAGAGGKAFEGRETSDYNHEQAVKKALSEHKNVPSEVQRELIKNALDKVARAPRLYGEEYVKANLRKENEEILAKDRAKREQIRAAERAEENELNAELNKLPPALKRHAETEITGTLHMLETHKDYRNRFVIALGKVRSIAFAHLPKAEKQEGPVEPLSDYDRVLKAYLENRGYELTLRDFIWADKYTLRGTARHIVGSQAEKTRRQEYVSKNYNEEVGKKLHRGTVISALERGIKVPDMVLKDYPDLVKKEVPVITAPKVQTIQDVKQQVIQSMREAMSMGELKQILKGLGFLPLPEPDKRQLLDLYQVRLSELAGELTFGQRITEEESKKRKAPRKVTYVPGTSRRLEEFGIRERIRGYGYA